MSPANQPVQHEGFLPGIARSARYALRRLARRPGFTLVAVASLALGIGANTAIFTLVNELLIRNVPLKDPAELVEIFESSGDFPYNTFSLPDLLDVREHTEGILTGFAASRFTIGQTDDGASFMTPGQTVSGDAFETLGIEPALGRLFSPQDDVDRGGHPVVVLADRWWRESFAADPAIVGQPLRLSGREYTVVGIAPASFPGTLRGIEPSFYVPMAMVNEIQGNDFDEHEARGNHSIFVTARLAPGATIEQLETSLATLASDLHRTAPDQWQADSGFTVVPKLDIIVYPALDVFVRSAAWLLSVVVGLVLVIACTNLASFLLAQGLDRRKEIALRLALGASRQALIAQLLVESLMLGVAGGLAGIVLAKGLLTALTSADLPLPVPVTLDLSLDTTILVYTFAISLAAGLLLGLVPALQSTRPDVATTLKEETAGDGGARRQRLRSTLVAAQVALSTVLAVGAGLFLRSMAEIAAVDPGFGHRPAAVLDLNIPATIFAEDEGRRAIDSIRRRVSALPGIEAVGFTSNLHLNTLSTNNTDFDVDGVAPPPNREHHSADVASVDAGFFDAAGVPLLEGRLFRDSDVGDRSGVTIVSRALAQRFWPGESAIGRVLHSGDTDLEIIGVAADAKVRSLGESPRPFIYRSSLQSYSTFLTMVARTRGDGETAALQVLAATRAAEPDVWVWQAGSMKRHLGIVQLPAVLSAGLLTVFGGLALILAAIGLYGVVSYAVAARRREFAIRMSLGAAPAAVARLALGTGALPVLTGGLIGLVLAGFAGRLLAGLLFGVDPSEPMVFLVAAGVLALTALLATAIPAIRAMRLNPVAALRAE